MARSKGPVPAKPKKRRGRPRRVPPTAAPPSVKRRKRVAGKIVVTVRTRKTYAGRYGPYSQMEVSIPWDLRKRLGWKAGTVLEPTVQGRALLLRP